MMNIILFRIKCFLSLAIYPFIFFSKDKRTILEEMRRHEHVLCLPYYSSNLLAFIRIFADLKEYRTLVLFRLGSIGKLLDYIIPTQHACYIITKTEEIGAGLLFHHGYSTVVFAERIGRNCQIWHNVTIGRAHNKGPRPIIEDNVKVCAGAVLLGKITIGSNSIIAANAVVVKDVPANCIVAGNPATIIKRDIPESQFF